MTQSVTGADESVAFTCLLDLYPWYAKGDSRITPAVTKALVDEWRERFAGPRAIGCYELARQMESTLLDVFRAEADRLGLSADPIR